MGKNNEIDKVVKKKKKKKIMTSSSPKSDRKRKKEFKPVKREHGVSLSPLDKRDKSKPKKKKKAENGELPNLDHNERKGDDEPSGRLKKADRKKKQHLSLKKKEEVEEEKNSSEVDEVYEISSGDEDPSKGMKKWITEFHESRPGLKILQQRIDDFIVDHETQEEQARKEREAEAAEGGWTVVLHHKGRKKTTDAESGITVGSVGQAAVLEQISRKKRKEVGPNFYRFQKRESQRNEVMMLQSKFEQEKRRIQQLRAARKFRPY